MFWGGDPPLIPLAEVWGLAEKKAAQETVVLVSPSGVKYALTVNDHGILKTVRVKEEK